jgi:hypothetical protein
MAGYPMDDKFEKFTERARKVLSLAQDEAQRFNHNYIGTEHLLLGLVREGDGVAAKVLANLGVELNKVRSAVEFIIGRGDRIVLGEIGLTPRAKKVIELAVDEARRLNHHYIGTEHLLLGLVREGEGIAAGVLESLGVNLEKVRTQTIQVLNGPGTDAPGSVSFGSTRAVISGAVLSRSRRRQAAVMTTSLLTGSALLLSVGVMQTTNNIASGMPGRVGMTITQATVILGAMCALQVAGLLLAIRAMIAGYALLFATALVWIASFVLDRASIVTAAAPYHDALLSQVLGWTILALGFIVVVMTYVTPVVVRVGHGRRFM